MKDSLLVDGLLNTQQYDTRYLLDCIKIRKEKSYKKQLLDLP